MIVGVLFPNWLLTCILLGHVGAHKVPPEVKMYCNTFSDADSAADWNGNYDLSVIQADTDHCYSCSTSMACPTKSMSIHPANSILGSMWQNPLCCKKHSFCECPDGMVSTSCTASALKNNIPIVNFFTDTAVPWGSSWQQKIAAQISDAVVAVAGLARVLTACGKMYTLRELAQAKNNLEEALGPLKYFESVYDIRDAKKLGYLIDTCDNFIGIAQKTRLALLDARYKVLGGRFKALGGAIETLESEIKVSPEVMKTVGAGEAVDFAMDFLFDRMRYLFDLRESPVAALFSGAAMLCSRSSYVSAIVRDVASKAWEVAKQIEFLEKTVENLAKLDSMLNPLLLVLVVSEVGEAVFEDIYDCGCCLQADSSLTQKRAVKMRKVAFEQVFREMPWAAIKAADVATHCLLSFKLADQLDKHESAMMDSVLGGLSKTGLDVPSCFASAYQNLTDWTENQVQTTYLGLQREISGLKDGNDHVSNQRCMQNYYRLQDFLLLLKELWKRRGDVEGISGIELQSRLEAIPDLLEVVQKGSQNFIQQCLTYRPRQDGQPGYALETYALPQPPADMAVIIVRAFVAAVITIVLVAAACKHSVQEESDSYHSLESAS